MTYSANVSADSDKKEKMDRVAGDAVTASELARSVRSQGRVAHTTLGRCLREHLPRVEVTPLNVVRYVRIRTDGREFRAVQVGGDDRHVSFDGFLCEPDGHISKVGWGTWAVMPDENGRPVVASMTGFAAVAKAGVPAPVAIHLASNAQLMEVVQ